jgi:hypothetical protein
MTYIGIAGLPFLNAAGEAAVAAAVPSRVIASLRRDPTPFLNAAGEAAVAAAVPSRVIASVRRDPTPFSGRLPGRAGNFPSPSVVKVRLTGHVVMTGSDRSGNPAGRNDEPSYSQI